MAAMSGRQFHVTMQEVSHTWKGLLDGCWKTRDQMARVARPLHKDHGSLFVAWRAQYLDRIGASDRVRTDLAVLQYINRVVLRDRDYFRPLVRDDQGRPCPGGLDRQQQSKMLDARNRLIVERWPELGEAMQLSVLIAHKYSRRARDGRAVVDVERAKQRAREGRVQDSGVSSDGVRA